MADFEQLRAELAAGAPLEVLAEAAVALLSDRATVAAEARDLAAALAALQREWQASNAVARAAWDRYAVYQPSGAHGVRADPRALELFGTFTYLARAGMYAPDELEGMLQRNEAPAAWVLREALRLHALLICLSRLMEDLDSGEVAPLAYADGVHALAKRFGQIVVATP